MFQHPNLQNKPGTPNLSKISPSGSSGWHLALISPCGWGIPRIATAKASAAAEIMAHARKALPAGACACTRVHFIVTIRQYPNSLMEGGQQRVNLPRNPRISSKKSLSKHQFLARNSCLSEQGGKRRRNSWRKN